jgi:hypothetical protein
LALFKLAIGYSGVSAEDIVEIEARTPSEARIKCEEMVVIHKEELDRLAKRNIYVSKIIRSCRLCSYGYKMDMVGVNEMLESLKNQV